MSAGISLAVRMQMATSAIRFVTHAGWVVESLDVMGDEQGPHLRIRPGPAPGIFWGLLVSEANVSGSIETTRVLRFNTCLLRWSVN
jgi:hypothetical protein